MTKHNINQHQISYYCILSSSCSLKKFTLLLRVLVFIIQVGRVVPQVIHTNAVTPNKLYYLKETHDYVTLYCASMCGPFNFTD